MCFLPFPIALGPSGKYQQPNANKFFQFFYILGTEDCLYVYVYVPREKIDAGENLDVVVHIHGGGFMYGSPSLLAGPDYIMDKDVIYVSFNYRLSILGEKFK